MAELNDDETDGCCDYMEEKSKYAPSSVEEKYSVTFKKGLHILNCIFSTLVVYTIKVRHTKTKSHLHMIPKFQIAFSKSYQLALATPFKSSVKGNV